jgi:predicted homoserine dehydrogenase-like protein
MMHIIDRKLEERASQNNPIKIAIIGCGEMGKGLLNQIHRYIPGIKVCAIYNRSAERVYEALKVAEVSEYTTSNNDDEIHKSISQGRLIVSQNYEAIINGEDIDCVIEMTGQIDFAAKLILDSFKAGKHVISFNAELESTLGYLLKSKAEEYGVRYTLGDGDQPGVSLNLYRQVKAMGLTPLMVGNIKGLQDKYRTPATQAAFAKSWGISPLMATCFADGTKISFEQACIANAIDMKVAKRGMIGFETNAHVDELAKGIDTEMLLEQGGIVDYALGAKPGPGVFVYATVNDTFSAHYLKYGKLGDGPLYSFYVPYHLLFLELAFSIVRLIDFNDVTLNAAYGMKVEVGTFAKSKLIAGTMMDGIGGFHSYGMCENNRTFKMDNLVPMGLSENMVLKNEIQKDCPITFDDVEVVDDSYTYQLYQLQASLLK